MDGPSGEASIERDRIVVVMATVVGVGYLVYVFVTLPVLVAEADGVVAAWFVPIGATVVFGPGLGMCAVRWVRRRRWYALAAGLACPLGALTGAALWVVAGIADVPEPAVWMLDFAGLPAVAVAVVRPMREAFVALVACKGAAVVVAVVHSPAGDTAAMVREGVFGMLFTSAFVYITAMVVRAGASLDASRSATADLVAAGVRNAELARIDGLIHDHVISTLVAVSADPHDPRLADSARTALARLDSLATGDDAEDDLVTDTELVARIRSVVDSAVDTVVDRGPQPCLYPVAVSRALAESVGEAVRNSLAHAGPDAECVVVIEVACDRVAAAIVDDGAGFDPDAVAIDRLGLSLSVRRRMEALHGGRSWIYSKPGHGTIVEVEWNRP